MKMIKINDDLIKIIVSIIFLLGSFFVRDTKYLHLIFIIISYIVISYELYFKAFKNIIKGEIFDENLLMIIATIGAFFLHEYTEGLMVILLFQIGEYLSDLAVDNSKESITELIDLKSEKVNLKTKEKIINIDINEIKIDDVLIVRKGEKIPTDGILLSSRASVDTSSLTGESIPRTITNSQEVLSGMINISDTIEIKATKEYKNSTTARIIELIENSNDKKTNTEKFITKFSKVYTPVVVILAILLTLIPTLLGYNFEDWLYKSLVFLVISCPCALVISVPLGFFMGIGRSSREGILVKGSNELDNLSKVNAVIFDKTGTITKGNFEVVNINGEDKNEVLKLSSYAEIHSTHPIAKSILDKYNKKIDEKKISKYQEIEGYGISYKYENDNILVGNKELFKKNKIDVKEINSLSTVIYVSKNKKIIGSIEISDVIKEESKNIVKNLNKLGITKTVMLSGDREEVVKDISDKVGIKEYFSNLLPLDKVKELKKLNKDYNTMFVGDGINDAAVIKLANSGVSMGSLGSDAAINASDVVIMNDDLGKISKSISISKLTRKVVIFNIIFALSVKLLMLILGVIGISSVILAVFADVGVTLIAILNTFIILKKKI